MALFDSANNLRFPVIVISERLLWHESETRLIILWLYGPWNANSKHITCRSRRWTADWNCVRAVHKWLHGSSSGPKSSSWIIL